MGSVFTLTGPQLKGQGNADDGDAVERAAIQMHWVSGQNHLPDQAACKTGSSLKLTHLFLA